jgi:hypothetical protein
MIKLTANWADILDFRIWNLDLIMDFSAEAQVWFFQFKIRN